jgi:hypothetical protein
VPVFSSLSFVICYSLFHPIKLIVLSFFHSHAVSAMKTTVKAVWNYQKSRTKSCGTDCVTPYLLPVLVAEYDTGNVGVASFQSVKTCKAVTCSTKDKSCGINVLRLFL